MKDVKAIKIDARRIILWKPLLVLQKPETWWKGENQSVLTAHAIKDHKPKKEFTEHRDSE